MRQQNHKTIALLEGTTDFKFWHRIIDSTQCSLLPSGGRDTVIKTILQLESNGVPGIAAIVDADFWAMDGVAAPSANIFVTDTRDMESLIVASSALDTLLGQLGSPDKIAKMQFSVRQSLLKAAIPIGFLRWLAAPHNRNIPISFKDIDYYRFVDKKTLNVDTLALVKATNRKGLLAKPDEPPLAEEVNTLVSTSTCDPWTLCQGHDLANILSIGLRHAFGGRDASRITPELTAAFLRQSYDVQEFAKTTVFSAITTWETNNSPFKLLR